MMINKGLQISMSFSRLILVVQHQTPVLHLPDEQISSFDAIYSVLHPDEDTAVGPV